MVRKFKKKLVNNEAIRFTNDNWEEVVSFTDNAAHTFIEDDICTCIIPALEGENIATAGDWIIKTEKGKFYTCKPDIFTATYEVGMKTKFSIINEFENGKCIWEDYLFFEKRGWKLDSQAEEVYIVLDREVNLQTGDMVGIPYNLAYVLSKRYDLEDDCMEYNLQLEW